jgi:glycerophosphodiester phosphodiesterase
VTRKVTKDPRSPSRSQPSFADSDDQADLSNLLSREIEKVEKFYAEKYMTLHRKARARYSRTHSDFSHKVDQFGTQLNKVALVELQKDLEKLRWYGRVNADGFRKILRKIEGLPSAGSRPSSNVQVAFSKLQFVGQSQCLKDVENLACVIALLEQKEPSMFQENFYCRIAEFSPSLSPILLYRAIKSDDAPLLEDQLDIASRVELASSFASLLHALVQCSIRLRSRLCTEKLLSQATSLPESDIIFDCLYDLIEELGQAKHKEKIQNSPQSAFDLVELTLLSFTLNQISAKQHYILLEKDSFGRTLLHYACAYGLADVCEMLLEYMGDRGLVCKSTSYSAILIPDLELNTPIELAVLGGYLDVITTLVKWHERHCGLRDDAHTQSLSQVFSMGLLFAIRSNSTEIVTFLLSAIDLNINYAGELGETHLYIAARSGNENFVKLLLEHEPSIDAYEKTNNWTPLIISCLEGYQHLTELLLDAGANVAHRDLSGWTALDHASYRGHIPLSKMLWERVKESPDSSAKNPSDHLATKMPRRGQPRRSISIASSQVIVNLGSLNTRKTAPAVYLTPQLFHDPSALYPESWFSLGISAVDAAGPNPIIQLPVLEDTSNIPWIFTTKDASKAKLVFNLYRANSEAPNGRQLIGSGIALLGSLGQGLGKTRSSLNIDYTIPILSKESLDYIGAVTFTFIVSTPLVLQDTLPIVTEELWHENGPTKVVGHRGLSILSI